MRKILSLLVMLAFVFGATAQKQVTIQTDPNAKPGGDAPMSKDVVINWDGPNDNSIGLTDGGVMETAMFIPDDSVTKYDGYEIYMAEIFINDVPASGTLTLTIWGAGAEPGTELYTQDVTADAVAASWNEFDLATPFVIDAAANSNIYVGIVADHGAGEYPIGVDAGPAVNEGDWVNLGSGWDHLGGYGFGNWNIRAHLESTAPAYTVTFNVDDGTDPIEGANINIDGTDLTTDASGVATTDLEDGTYSYTVSYQNCDDVNDDVTVSGGPEIVDISMTCYDVYSVTFSVTDGTNPIAGANVQIPDLTVDDYTDANGELVVGNVMAGTYSYTITAPGFAEYNDNFEVVDEDILVEVVMTGFDGINTKGVKIYPNPNNGIFNISVNEEYNLQILDITGKVIYSEVLNNSENSINISDNEAGVYLIRLTSGSKTINYKILVE